MLDIDHLVERRIPRQALRAFWVGLALAMGVFLLAAAGCGSVSAVQEVDAGAGSAGGGAVAGAGGAAGQAGGPTGGAGGRSGGGGLGGAAGAAGKIVDAGSDACVQIDGSRYCDPNAVSCPAGVPLATCPIGTVKAGPDGGCPPGDHYVGVYDICVPPILPGG